MYIKSQMFLIRFIACLHTKLSETELIILNFTTR